MKWFEHICNQFLGDYSPFKTTSASIAKERLKIIVSHERQHNSSLQGDFIQQLQEELLSVIAKYVAVDKDQVKVELLCDADRSVLELSAILPEQAKSL
jgi:cell division topological specificity factor